ncbi:hypothetical protein V3851_10340 [Paenibacillus sp. M1]|uniref:Uncharacterized protein n=1 Tax=Paenibacillus haidiansis TaxID=1574488 RepID=A0ABU7VR32_9BACL
MSRSRAGEEPAGPAAAAGHSAEGAAAVAVAEAPESRPVPEPHRQPPGWRSLRRRHLPLRRTNRWQAVKRTAGVKLAIGEITGKPPVISPLNQHFSQITGKHAANFNVSPFMYRISQD